MTSDTLLTESFDRITGRPAAPTAPTVAEITWDTPDATGACGHYTKRTKNGRTANTVRADCWAGQNGEFSIIIHSEYSGGSSGVFTPRHIRVRGTSSTNNLTSAQRICKLILFDELLKS
jgi:hypothetical protein